MWPFRKKQKGLEQFEEFISGEMGPREAASMAVIAAKSPEIKASLVRMERAVDLVRAAGSESDETAHLSNNELAQYISGDDGAVERARREAHLAECDECRGIFVRASAAYSVYEAHYGGPRPLGWNLRRWGFPLLLGIPPGVCLGLYILGYFLTPYDPPWVAGLCNSVWVQIIGVVTGVYAIYILAKRRV